MGNNKMTISEFSDIFSKTAVECLGTLFGAECKSLDDWKIVPQLQAEYDNVIIMGSANNDFQAILAIGVNDTSIEAFVGNSLQKSEIFDAFGEVANTYCAMIIDKKEFSDKFGALNQSIPVLYSKGTPFLPFISGIEGKVYSNEHFVYFGFAIQKKQSIN